MINQAGGRRQIFTATGDSGNNISPPGLDSRRQGSARGISGNNFGRSTAPANGMKSFRHRGPSSCRKSPPRCPLRAAWARSHRGIHIFKVHFLAARGYVSARLSENSPFPPSQDPLSAALASQTAPTGSVPLAPPGHVRRSSRVSPTVAQPGTAAAGSAPLPPSS